MSDALQDSFSFGGNPGEAVPEVDPDDLKAFWQEGGGLHASRPGYAVGFEHMKAICKPGANAQAVCYRSSMIWVLNRVVQEQLAPWIKDEEVSAAVFEAIATIPMEWLGPTVREGLPFDVEEFFRRLKEGGVQNG